MNTYIYYGIEVKQTPEAMPFYLLVSSADDILRWADVPRKQENFLAGYQRQLDERHETIREYLSQPESEGRNIIPSSIIIAAESSRVAISEADKNGLFKIEVSVDEKDTDVLLQETLVRLRARLGIDELASIQMQENGVQDVDAESEEGDELPPESYLAVIVKKLEEAQGKLDNLSPEFRADVEEYLRGISKPGLILDGQHRVFGAKDVSAFSVNLPVVLLPGLEFSEQVFHFYVLNNKARPLNKTELRSIIATSLSKGEIEHLYDRFKQVGVTAEETGWTYKMNTDKDSPFNGIVNFGFPGSKAPIPENVAYQVVSKFVKLSKKYKMLYSDVQMWERDVQSGSDYRLKLFFAIWRAVKKAYPAAWESAANAGKGQILQKVNLIVLQEFLLDKLVAEMPKRKAKSEPSPFADADVLEEEVGYQLAFLSEEFFVKEWKMKGLDTALGHKAFRDQIEEAVNNQSQNLGNRRLFRATTT